MQHNMGFSFKHVINSFTVSMIWWCAAKALFKLLDVLKTPNNKIQIGYINPHKHVYGIFTGTAVEKHVHQIYACSNLASFLRFYAKRCGKVLSAAWFYHLSCRNYTKRKQYHRFCGNTELTYSSSPRKVLMQSFYTVSVFYNTCKCK